MNTMNYGLNENIIKDMQKVFAGFGDVDAVVLYGSRAKGNYKTGSDIDLTFKGNQLSLSMLNKIALQLDDLYLPYTFDLSIYQHIDNPELLEHIDRVGVEIYHCR